MGKLNVLVRYIVRETVKMYKELSEASTTGGVAGYNTPFAFSGGRAKDKKKLKQNIKSSGYTDTVDEIFDRMESEILDENRWLELKRDDSRNSYRKIADGTSYVKKQLKEIDKYLKWYGRIKKENELTPEKYHTRARKNIEQIHDVVERINQKLNALRNEK